MLNIGVGSIITNGLGGPACNLLIFGPFRMYIEPVLVTPTPTATSVTPTPSPSVPVPTPTPSSGGGAGGAGAGFGSQYDDYEDDDEEEQLYKLTFVVNFRKKEVKRTFIVDSFKKDKIIKRVGQINTLRLKFKVGWNKVKNSRFITRWKK
jgi:hypothetical protein